MDWTASFLDAAGTTPAADTPIDGVSLLPWLVEGEEHPDHTLFWRISSQGALRKGTYKYLVDGRDKALLGNWPRYPGTRHYLYDLSGDGRECADLSRWEADRANQMRVEWERIDATLLPYPPGHKGIPRHATPTQPAVSRAD